MHVHVSVSVVLWLLMPIVRVLRSKARTISCLLLSSRCGYISVPSRTSDMTPGLLGHHAANLLVIRINICIIIAFSPHARRDRQRVLTGIASCKVDEHKRRKDEAVAVNMAQILIDGGFVRILILLIGYTRRKRR